MEAMDKLEARKALRLDPRQVLKNAEVKTPEDIKRIVAEFDPKKNVAQAEIPISAIMTVEDNVKYKVESKTRSKSKRDMIVEGLNIIKARLDSAKRVSELQESIEINGMLMKPASLGYKSEGASWVDPLIKQWMGAYREGILICWNLDGYVYRYDIYQHKLTRTKTQDQ